MKEGFLKRIEVRLNLIYNFLPDFLGFVFDPGVSKLFSLRKELMERKM